MNLLYTNSESKIVYGFHERKIVLYAKFAMHLLLWYIEIYLLDWRKLETLFIYDVVLRSLLMSYIQSKGREANKKKKYIFFLLPVALFDQRLLSYRERSYFALLSLLQQDLFLMGAFFLCCVHVLALIVFLLGLCLLASSVLQMMRRKKNLYIFFHCQSK